MNGCAPTVKTVTKIEYAVPNEQLIQPCSPFQIEVASNGELLMALINLNAEYRICAARMDAVNQYFEKIKILNETID